MDVFLTLLPDAIAWLVAADAILVTTAAHFGEDGLLGCLDRRPVAIKEMREDLACQQLKLENLRALHGD